MRLVPSSLILAASVMAVSLPPVTAQRAGSTPQKKPAAPNCRTFPSTFRTQQSGVGFSGVANSTCQFDRQSLELRCTHQYSDTRGNASTTTVTTKYASLNDVLEEVTVNPPLRRSLWSETVQKSSRGTTSNRLENTYDVQGRLRSDRSPQATTTYSSWDDAGRPTYGESHSAGSQAVHRIVYGPASIDLTTTAPQGSLVCKKAFDPHGNEISNSCTGPTKSVSSLLTTITGTAQVCKAE